MDKFYDENLCDRHVACKKVVIHYGTHLKLFFSPTLLRHVKQTTN